MPIAQQCNGAVVVSVWNLIGSIALPAGGVLPTRAAPARNLASDRVVIRAGAGHACRDREDQLFSLPARSRAAAVPGRQYVYACRQVNSGAVLFLLAPCTTPHCA
jgi:hypothetical protein